MTPDEIQTKQKEPRGEIMKYQELIRTIEEKHIQDYCPCDEHGKDPQWKCLGCAKDGLDVIFPCDVATMLIAYEELLAECGEKL